MEFMLWVIIGVVAAGLFIAIARALDQERLVFGSALMIAGVWYVSFGVLAGRDAAVLLPQILGGAVFLLCGLAGIRHSILFLSFGWLVHVGWDFGSPLFSDVSYMPSWTVPACLGFDLLVGGYLFLRFRGGYPISAQAAAGQPM